jgi:hypothetical protein
MIWKAQASVPHFQQNNVREPAQDRPGTTAVAEPKESTPKLGTSFKRDEIDHVSQVYRAAFLKADNLSSLVR